MKKIIIGTIIGLCSFATIAQNDSLVKNQTIATQEQRLSKESAEIKTLIDEQTKKIEELNKKIQESIGLLDQNKRVVSELKQENNLLEKQLDSVSKIVSTNSSNIVTLSEDLGTKIQETDKNADNKISKLSSKVDENKLYLIIGVLATLLIGVVIFWLLRKRIASSKTAVESQIVSSKTDVESQINKAKKTLEEESVKIDSKLVEILESQLKIQQAESSSNPSNSAPEKQDHSLALKVADEIVRMQKNISRMDEGTKGLKPLVKGVERIQENFAANGYEMINLLNKDYKVGANVNVINFLQDGNLPEGTKIYTKIIKPQVNFNGKLIQQAQVEVTQN